MLTVYRSNRSEILAQLLAAQLRLHPPDPFTPVEVIVNTWPTSRWLGEQLAVHLGGIAAHLRFPFPGAHLRRIVASLLDDAPEGPAAGAATMPEREDDPWRADRLVWPLLDLLPSIAARPEAGPLRGWLTEAPQDGRSLGITAWQLARTIADAFDDYGLYRPDLLLAWEAGRAVDGRGRPLPAVEQWQPLLYAALKRHLVTEPFGLRVHRAIERLRRKGPPPPLPAEPLRLFGLSSLAPVQVQLLQALSGWIPVDLFLLTPCRDLWQRCADRRDRLSDGRALLEPLDAEWLLEAPGLEARFGRLGAEFQQLLEGTGTAQLGAWEERDLFFAPATARPRPQGTAAAARAAAAPLLAQLQEQLADPAQVEALTLREGDFSLEFHPCPGHLRQVQILRDRILQLLAADPGLEPRDILVMTPQVERFAPLIASVFGDTEATGVELPWRLTDRSQQARDGIAAFLLRLLRQAGERLTASGLESLLDCRPLRQRFALAAEEILALHGALQDCGFRWGLDAGDRAGDPTHSLSWAIDRQLLGLVLPALAGLAPGGAAPWPGPGQPERTGRWLHLLTRLRHWLQDLRRSRPCEAWCDRLRALLPDLFNDGGEHAWELPSVLAAIDDWQRIAAGCERPLEAAVVAAVLEEGLSVDSGRFGHRSGALTISALEPMRAIPHRVIVLMGLDAAEFPRQRHRPGFHLMESQRRLGDPTPADQDRYVLLEALLSARDHLLISWSCRDDRSGEPLQPATAVRQWQDWLQSRLGKAADRLTVVHAASPLHPDNFRPHDGRPPVSCDLRLLDARRRLDREITFPPTALARSEAPPCPAGTAAVLSPFEDLRRWLMTPQTHWLSELGLRPRERDQPLEDLEALEGDERLRAALLRRRVTEAEAEASAPADAADWIQRTLGQGLLPPGAAALLEAGILQQRWLSLRSSLTSLGPARREPLVWGPWQGTPERRGEHVVLVHLGREKAPQRMDLWLHLLLTAAAAPRSAPRSGLLLCRRKDSFEPGVRLTCPPPEEARRELERLAALRERWRQVCWPVPPRTGLALLEEEHRRPGRGPEAATLCWEGGVKNRAEREEPEMALCFGADRPAADLLTAAFTAHARDLYGPMQEALE